VLITADDTLLPCIDGGLGTVCQVQFAEHIADMPFDCEFADDQLVGFGRAISDGAYQAAIYDCAVSEAYQGRGLGKLIIKELLAKIPGCNVILYATPGKEGFYEKLGFRKMKTGLACFINRDGMQKRGFTE
jgi:ribosomal protein S18 acetylase RimI-like enzyme